MGALQRAPGGVAVGSAISRHNLAANWGGARIWSLRADPAVACFARGGADEKRTAWVAVVNVSVTEGEEAEFLAATLENARESVKEDYNLRFDVLVNKDDTRNFLLVEAYSDAQGPRDHKATKHYDSWRSAVADSMARPREAAQYDVLFPSSSSGLEYKTVILEREPPAFLHISHVYIEVLPGKEQAFIDATIPFAEASAQEYDSVRFDFFQSVDDPTKFMYSLVCKTESGVGARRNTDFYKEWASRVAPLMAARRVGKRLANYFPNVAGAWKS